MTILIQVEGARGMGKDTFCMQFSAALEEATGMPVTRLINPTQSLYGESALFRVSRGMNDLETALLYTLDRIQGDKEAIFPERGFVLYNRYSLSTFAYQGILAGDLSEKMMHALAAIHLLIRKPHATILLDADYALWSEIHHARIVEDMLNDRRLQHGATPSTTAYKGDRASLRKKDAASKHSFDLSRNAYLEALSWLSKKEPSLVGRVKILRAFQDTENMLEKALDFICPLL